MAYTHQPKIHYKLPHGLEDSHRRSLSGAVIVTSQIIWLVTGLLIELLAVRFMIAFLGANPANSFFGFIYSISQPFIEPFANLFSDMTQIGPNRIEFYTLIAIAFYAFVGYGLAKLLSHGEE